ncbi:MAG: glycogen synthase GlgA [Clostridiales bacterium]|nr:MAG: glycogen synthase GlgA [Clostridiales bacterium]
MKQAEKLKILIVSSEAAPFVKSGGLGDVVGSLPKALRKLGADVRVVIPKFRKIKNENYIDVEYLGGFDVKLGWRTQKAGVLFKNGEVPTYFIENDFYFGRDELYGYDDDNERFAFFSKAVLDMLPFADFVPDIIHCNDWQTGPVPMLLRETYKKITYLKDIKTIYTIHNLQYQGNFDPSSMEMLDLPWYLYDNGTVEFYGRMSYMKAGLVYADIISTVSETYADEIQTEEYGYGFDGIIRAGKDRLRGIINGIDYETNNPETDKRIDVNYSADNAEAKKENKRLLQERLGLEQRDVPMICMISRLADQKGLDILANAMERLMQNDIQFVILGTGEKRYEDMFRYYENRWKGRFCSCIMFDDTLAQKIYASGDMFLMPSRFEPCGLGQMFSLRYGTVPVVRKTGGLADSVEQFNGETGTGNGFLFETYDAEGILWAVGEALKIYTDTDKWNTLVKNCMNTKLSWSDSAEKYMELYKEMLNN